jgi:hypothetical protein
MVIPIAVSPIAIALSSATAIDRLRLSLAVEVNW